MSDTLANRLRKEALAAKGMYPRTGRLVPLLEEAADLLEQPTTIYIVEGRTGEYDEQTEWIVCAYRNSEKAKQHVESAQRRANEIRESGDYWEVQKLIDDKANEFDPQMKIYRTVEYYFYPTELR